MDGQHFDSGYKSRRSKRGQPKPVGEITQRLDELTAAYTAHLAARVGRDQIGTRSIVWTPTLLNRNEKFREQGRRMIVAALAGATATELELLDQFVGSTAAKKLRERGVLPDGLTDHWKHPLRAGGSVTADNVCIMTRDLHKTLKTAVMLPAFAQAYSDPTNGIVLTIDQLEAQAADYLIGSGQRELPKSLIRRVRVPDLAGVIEISQADLDMQDYRRKETDAIEARRIMLGRERPNHRRSKASGPHR